MSDSSQHGALLQQKSIEDVRDFLLYLTTERGRAEQTQLAYERDLTGFCQFCALKGLSVRDVSYQDLRLYLASLRSKELAPRTIARKVSAIKQFYLFLLRERRIGSDPAELVCVLVKGTKLPKHLTVKEIERLLAVPNTSTEAGIRDRALLELWYATGCRVSELARLVVSEVDWQQHAVKLFGKGSRQRFVPVNAEAMAWCTKYRQVRHGWLKLHDRLEEDTFFLNDRAFAFTRQNLWAKVKQAARDAGIERPVWPHMIRHSFATHVLQGGADLRVVQQMLGHRSIATTQIYTHLDPEDLRTMQRKFHPRS